MAKDNTIKPLAESVQKSVIKLMPALVETEETLDTVQQENEVIPSKTGYMARAMVLATIPHSKLPDNITVYERKNGDYSLSLLANPKYGLPYGTIPRMLMSWVSMEAVRTQNPTIMLGDTLSDFMRRLGYTPTGGKKGTIQRLKEQAKRLFTTGVSCTYHNPKRGLSIRQTYIAKDYSEWWLPYSPNQRTLWESHVILSHDFFQEIVNRPVPISLETLANLRKSPMALDIYFWLTHRNFGHASMAHIGVDTLQHQFGAGYPSTEQGKRDFKKKFLQALKKVSETYSAAEKLRFDDDVLVVLPGRPDVTHVPAVQQPIGATAPTTPAKSDPTKSYTAPKELSDIQKAESCWEMINSMKQHNKQPGAFSVPVPLCPQSDGDALSKKCTVCQHNPLLVTSR